MREKWRERDKRAEERNTQRTAKGSFPFIKTTAEGKTPQSNFNIFLEPVLDANMKVGLLLQIQKS